MGVPVADRLRVSRGYMDQVSVRLRVLVRVGWLAVIEDGVRDAVSGRVTVRRNEGVAVPEGLHDFVEV